MRAGPRMIQDSFTGRRVLLLQGPLGPFFRQLATRLRAQGATVLKINFNGGDELFYPGAHAYRGRMEDLGEYLRRLILAERIDVLVLFGDCRPAHRPALELARDLGLDVQVYEEGYFRPSYVTCERSGVNARSTLSTNAAFYRDLPSGPEPAALQPPRFAFWSMALWAVLYYLAAAARRDAFPNYRHHRPLKVIKEGWAWVRSAARKAKYAWRERGVQEQLVSQASKRFFLAPLQVHNDAQVKMHSRFADVSDFIDEVIGSFARNAAPDHLLVFKHHPMDRGYRDYTRLIHRLIQAHGLAQRVVYIHDQHLPTLLDHALGAVVINSTAGLSAIHQGIPTAVLGRTFYNFEGLTWQAGLDTFWSEGFRAPPERDLYLKFRRWVIQQTQINDNFYAPIRGSRPPVERPAREAPAPEPSQV